MLVFFFLIFCFAKVKIFTKNSENSFIFARIFTAPFLFLFFRHFGSVDFVPNFSALLTLTFDLLALCCHCFFSCFVFFTFVFNHLSKWFIFHGSIPFILACSSMIIIQTIQIMLFSSGKLLIISTMKYSSVILPFVLTFLIQNLCPSKCDTCLSRLFSAESTYCHGTHPSTSTDMRQCWELNY